MLQGNALREQIIIPEQRMFYDYWRTKCNDSLLPSRHDISPEDIKDFLPTVSLIELCQSSDMPRFRFRLAGTAFWDYFNDEITGQYVDELPLGSRCKYWDRILHKICHTKRPTVGVTRPGTPNGSHLAQFWVRLPLSDDGVNVNMILGFDHFVKLSAIVEENPHKAAIYA